MKLNYSLLDPYNKLAMMSNFSNRAHEIEKWFAHDARFIISAANISDLPISSMSEVAFIGRSNVGKSSIINAILKNKKMARVSNTPGRTKQLNFFLVANKLHIVDLPGYGYAKASKKEITGWNQLIYDYLRGRIQLKRIFLLIDARLGLKKSDIEMIEFLSNYATLVQIVLTKVDKLKLSEMDPMLVSTKKEIQKFAICYNEIITTSSTNMIGIDLLREEIYHLGT